MKITMIAAMTKDGVIGRNGDIPWNIPSEQQHFAKETIGHPVIMGRETFENIASKLPGPLPNRLNIVLSHSKSYTWDGVVAARNPQAALEAAMDTEVDEVYIAGGESVYREFMSKADRLVLSFIDGDYIGDSHFPKIPVDEWKETSRDEREEFTVVEYERY